MLTRLQIQNFQAHEKLRIELDAGVTTIVGPSDVGKSAIIRALRWVLQNAPQGTAFIREGAPGCTVKVEVDGKTITRKRAVSGDNLYQMDGTAEWKAFGVNVPDTVAGILNVSDVNFQGQHDASFWLSESAGEVSRQLNAVVDLSIIDSTMEEINRRVRAAQQQTQIRRDDLKKAKATKESLEWAAEADVHLQAVEVRAEHTADLAAVAVQLRAACQTVRQHQEHLGTVRQRLEQVVKVGRAAQVVLKTRTQRLAVQESVQNYRKYDLRVRRGAPDTSTLDAAHQQCRAYVGLGALSVLIKKAKQQRSLVNQEVPDLAVLNTHRQAYDEAAKKRTLLKGALSGIRHQYHTNTQMSSDLEKIQSELEELTDGFCPVCNRPME